MFYCIQNNVINNTEQIATTKKVNDLVFNEWMIQEQ